MSLVRIPEMPSENLAASAAIVDKLRENGRSKHLENEGSSGDVDENKGEQVSGIGCQAQRQLLACRSRGNLCRLGKRGTTRGHNFHGSVFALRAGERNAPTQAGRMPALPDPSSTAAVPGGAPRQGGPRLALIPQ
jgi:hypothetical protein